MSVSVYIDRKLRRFDEAIARPISGAAPALIVFLKPHPHSPRQHITHVGGVNPQGQFCYHTREQVVDMIDSGKYSFHVKVGIYDFPVRTYVLHGIKYLRTAPDDTTRDNQLSLDQCPVRGAAYPPSLLDHPVAD